MSKDLNVTNEDDLQICEKLCSETIPMTWIVEQSSISQKQKQCLMTFAEHEALKYVSGYIAFKVKKKDPTLGNISANVVEDL
ncbi:hypothetical protein JTE90_025249 [Oedothorax gibbosus]|uniref:Uncharacterized protein n=1 Tax=Oedothorax gibbosus TaxID=931172 RepID=A0AAV6U6Y8_9ARAC|nr:hypothetical protein JTE90_025249 [Oedothorax gibbosus]